MNLSNLKFHKKDRGNVGCRKIRDREKTPERALSQSTLYQQDKHRERLKALDFIRINSRVTWWTSFLKVKGYDVDEAVKFDDSYALDSFFSQPSKDRARNNFLFLGNL